MPISPPLLPTPTSPTDSWVVEDKLGYRHVMGDSTVLPNGKVLLYGGAQVGKRGQGVREAVR